jgi:hypothetical protein
MSLKSKKHRDIKLVTVLGALSEVGFPLGKIVTQGRIHNLLINSIIKARVLFK